MQFKVGDKVRFKGRNEWTNVTEVDGDDVAVACIPGGKFFPSSTFTAQPFKSIHRVPFRCAILPLTKERIKKSASKTGLSEGKLIDQWAEGAAK